MLRALFIWLSESKRLRRFAEHPAVAYEMLMDLAILGVLMILIRRWGGTGKVFWCYVLMYAVGRFFAEPEPDVVLRQPSFLWHWAKIGFERMWLWRWF